MAEQLGLADPVVTVAVARAFGARRNDDLRAGIVESGAAEVVILTLGVVAPVASTLSILFEIPEVWRRRVAINVVAVAQIGSHYRECLTRRNATV